MLCNSVQCSSGINFSLYQYSTICWPKTISEYWLMWFPDTSSWCGGSHLGFGKWIKCGNNMQGQIYLLTYHWKMGIMSWNMHSWTSGNLEYRCLEAVLRRRLGLVVLYVVEEGMEVEVWMEVEEVTWRPPPSAPGRNSWEESWTGRSGKRGSRPVEVTRLFTRLESLAKS